MMAPVAKETNIGKLLAKYKHPTATKREIMNVITSYQSLQYRMQRFVFNDGSSKDLLNLRGTIPIVYKLNTYYIPICIWVMDTHPMNAPICYVEPTSYMQIKVSMYVDHNGRIYLPYLHNWQPKTSDLLSLIQVMIVTFGEYPPVFSKPKEELPSNPTTSASISQPGGSNVGIASVNSVTTFKNTAEKSVLPYPTNPAAYMPCLDKDGSLGNRPEANDSLPPYMSNPHMPNYKPSNPSNVSSTGTITEEHIKASLVSALQDKVHRRIYEKVNQYQAEIETLNRTKQELIEGSTKIDAIITRLQHEEEELQKNLRVLHVKEQDLQKVLESFETSEEIDPDEAIVTTAPLYKQLLNAYAEEAATEDTIYYLGEALRSSVIDLETFLKHIRQLSRKQFMLRAIMQKCRQKAGLVG